MSEALHALVAELGRLPASPRSLTGPRNWLNGILLFSDYLASVPPRMTRLTSPLRKYPRDFERIRFRSADGTLLCGWLGRSRLPGPRPGLVLIPGLFTSKDNNRIRARSVKILREWGFHILTLDLRGVGESQRALSTPGWKEADDIVAGLNELRRRTGASPVHLYAESLAATAALLAVGREGAHGRALTDGRVVSVSPFADPRFVVQRFAGPIDWDDRALAGAKAFFKFVLRLGGTGHRDFQDYAHESARSYGVSLEEMMARSDPRPVLPAARSETLILHSHDDAIVPVEQAHQLQAATLGNPAVRILLLPWGNHCLYEMAEPDWYWAMLARSFGATLASTPVGASSDGRVAALAARTP